MAPAAARPTHAPFEARTWELDAVGNVVRVDRPALARGDVVVVRTSVVPMCTEFKERAQRLPTDRLGHEAMGVVIDAGSSARVRNGERVVVMPHFGCGACDVCLRGEHIYCRHQRDLRGELEAEVGLGAFADTIVRPDHILLPVPDDISDEHASLACCTLGPALTAAERMSVGPGQTVLVSGCGPVGLGAIVLAVDRGARVIAVSPNAYRAALARSVGASQVLDPATDDVAARVLELTWGAGVDAVLETSGVPSALRSAVECLRPLGQVAVVAWGAALELAPPVPSGLTLHACWHWNHQLHADGMWATIRRSAPLLDAIVTHRFPIDRAAEAMDLQDTGACGKILLHT